MKMLQAIPAMLVRDIALSIGFYRDKLGFDLYFQQEGFAIFRRDGADIHVWLAGDESWRSRPDISNPIISGAESFIAGTASCRIQVHGVDEYYKVVEPLGVLHPCGHIEDTDYGTREFGTLDPDGNLVTFFERR